MPNRNDDFMNNPLEFARRQAIDAGGGNDLEHHVAANWGKDKSVGGAAAFQVKGAKRIIGCEIMDAEDNQVGQDFLLGRIGRVEFKRRQVGAADSMPVYWLPWVKNGSIRTTLRPQKAQHNPQHDPDLFFTAGLNGCMIFIEGARDQPTVYHANAISTHGPNNASTSPGELFGSATPALAQACIQAKVDLMTAQYRQVSQAHPKLARNEAQPAVPRPPLPATAGAVKQTDYLVYQDGPPSDQKNALVAALGAQSTTGRNDEVTIDEGVGTVFGIRDGAGLWTFYCQKIAKVVRIRFTKRSAWARHARGKAEWKPHVQPAEWVVVEAKQFWPNVNGGAAQFQIGRY